MKYISLVSFIMLYCLYTGIAQDTIPKNKKIKIYSTWISLNSEPFKTQGILYEIKDSTIMVLNSFAIQDYSKDPSKIMQLQIDNIETMRFRRNNNIAKGILFGAITGFAVGAFIGLVSEEPTCSGNSLVCLHFSAGESAVMAGTSLAVGGAIVGGFVGAIKIKIPINGSKDNFNKNRGKLREYSVNKN